MNSLIEIKVRYDFFSCVVDKLFISFALLQMYWLLISPGDLKM